jgi:uncharacterized membrane protein YdcZ (DUF606 family)
MELEQWGAGRMLLLLGGTFLVGIFLAIGILFRMGAEELAVSEQVRASVAFTLAGGVVASWLFLLISAAMPQLRSTALVLLIVAFLANMAVPSFLPLVK